MYKINSTQYNKAFYSHDNTSRPDYSRSFARWLTFFTAEDAESAEGLLSGLDCVWEQEKKNLCALRVRREKVKSKR